MRRTIPFMVAVVATTVAVLAVVGSAGVVVGAPDTISGGTPSAVFMNTEPEACADGVDINGFAFMPTNVTVTEDSNLLVSFTSEYSGVDPRTELLLAFEVTDGEGNFPGVASTPFEWGLVGTSSRAHSTATATWTFADVATGEYLVWASARVDPIPGPLGGGHPSATLENCALTVFVIPSVP